MSQFELKIPTRIYFGEHIALDALKKEKSILGSRVMVVMTGDILVKLGYYVPIEQKLKEMLGEQNVVAFKEIQSNPDVEDIQKAIDIGKTERVTSVIGFGGGSAIDAAKATAVGIPVETPIADYLLKGLVPGNVTLPVIAIPTTAGTGAELTKGAILSSHKHKIKGGVRSENLTPTVAIVDPVYTWSLPLGVTMETGFDAMTHAVESYCAVKANPFSDMLSERAIKTVGRSLRELVKNLDDHGARADMSFAANLMGFNVKNVGNCLPHRMQYPIGVITGTSHGIGLAALYPAWIRHEFDVNTDRINNILEWLGYHRVKDGIEAKKCMESFLEELGLICRLSDLGCFESADVLARMVSGNTANDRLACLEGIVEKLYAESM